MYIHIASTYSIITLFAGDIWSNEIIIVIVQDLGVNFMSVRYPRGDALLLSETICFTIFVISAIFFNTDNRERRE